MKKKISTILVISWMSLIFVMSSFNSDISSAQSGVITNIISNIFNIDNLTTLSYIIRKLAHFTEYFILGILVYNMINLHNKKIYSAIIICIIYAISDEIHQTFIAGRSCQIADIFIDILGSTIAITLRRFKNKHIQF